MDERRPIHVVDMASRTGAHESRWHYRNALELAPFVQRLALHQAAGLGAAFAIAARSKRVFLHHEPLRESPRADAGGGRPRLRRCRWRRVEPWRGNVRDALQCLRKARLGDLLQILRPSIQAADDGRVLGQVDERTGAVGGDHLALANAAERPAHD